jgi:steroid 5-alpha reductase family enzyme
MGQAIVLALAVALGINLVLFLMAYRWQSDKLTDISYALSFLAIDVVGLVTADGLRAYNCLAFLLVAVWAARIGGFLLIRILKFGKDGRFDELRGSFVKFGKFWLGQALTAWVLMLPVIMVQSRGGELKLLVWAGVAVWLIGLVVEAMADYQKFRFKLAADKPQPWIDSGLWRYSRHPNYFGEITVWAGVYIYCFEALSGWGRLIGLASPLLIAAVLLFVSGVPMLEKSADKRWGKDPKYKAYKRRTRLLLPLPR